ncbi:MAG TPA: sodium:solute symporter [Lacipirellula sp.]
MLANLNLAVLLVYLGAIFACGCWFAVRKQTPDAFMAASRSLPGWAIGLSMFGSYISSISFLANPGKSYATNWNAFVFSLATPLAAAVAVRWFVPFYRNSGHVSAYEHLERRFGRWARTYAVTCFLLTQVARMGTVVYLLALAVSPLTGWSPFTTVLVTASLMTFCAFTGGISALVWIGVLQAFVLITGTLICLVTLLDKAAGGLRGIVETAFDSGKLSLGSYEPSFSEPTVWVLLLFGLVTHLTNFGVDQSYVQRYITARSDREAAQSIWLTTALYVPVAAIFFFIGSGLAVFYGAAPEVLPSQLKADHVFPHFISTELPPGMAGLVVAAIFAASMDSNLSSMATLTLCDVYRPYLRPQAGPRESMAVLRISTLVWGAVSAGVGLLMIRTGSALDAWWTLAGVFSGGMLGLFLLGLFSRVDNAAAAMAVAIGVLVIMWMTAPLVIDVPPTLSNPWHAHMTMVVGTLVIFLAGQLISFCCTKAE